MTERISSPDRNSPDYIRAVVEKKPHADDPKDIRIQQIIRDTFLQEEWARDAFMSIHERQVEYMKDAIHNVDNPDYVSRLTQETLKAISDEMHSTIESGKEYLDELHGRPVLIMTNHLGTYKLTGINPQTDLGDDVEKYEKYDFMYPYPLYFAAINPVAEELGDSLSYTSDDFPGVYGQVHTEAGFVHVPPPSIVTSGRINALIEQTAELLSKRPNTAIINFPEGGTSGKYNEAGPYDLLDFKTGGYVVAAELDIPVLTVAQYFDPKEGMKLKVFKPIKSRPQSKEEYQVLASNAQSEMQAWLNQKEQNQSL